MRIIKNLLLAIFPLDTFWYPGLSVGCIHTVAPQKHLEIRIIVSQNVKEAALVKFLKKAYIQRAISEEAKGNYKQAAAYYSKAEEYEKVGEMYETVGDMTRSFPARIREYQQALRWYKKPDHLIALAAKLAKIMEVEIRADAKVSVIERQRLQKAAEYYAVAKQWKEAGRLYEELDMLDEATEMYVQGGEIELVEKLSARKEVQSHRNYTAQQYFDEAEAVYNLGKREKAYQALKQCLAIDKNHARARAVFTQLDTALHAGVTRTVRIPMDEREFILFPRPLITIGRQEDNCLVLTQHDISRHHARIGVSNGHLLIEDLQSSNGTRINGLRIRERAEIRDRDTICIGRHSPLEARVWKRSAGISASFHPTGQKGMQTYYLLAAREIQVGTDRKCEMPLQEKLAGFPPCFFKVHYHEPFWVFHFHPHLTGVELNGVGVEHYLVVLPGDTISVGGITFLIE